MRRAWPCLLLLALASGCRGGLLSRGRGGVVAPSDATAARGAVPDVRGRDVAAARAAIERAGFVLGRVEPWPDALGYPAGTVVGQRPARASDAPLGSEVDVRVYGIDDATADRAMAAARIGRRAPLAPTPSRAVPGTSPAPTPTAPPTLVGLPRTATTFPPAASPDAAPTPAMPAAPLPTAPPSTAEAGLVPDLVGFDVDAATAAAQRAGFDVVALKVAGTPAGRVVTQDLSPGRPAPLGSPIGIHVANGEPGATVTPRDVATAPPAVPSTPPEAPAPPAPPAPTSIATPVPAPDPVVVPEPVPVPVPDPVPVMPAPAEPPAPPPESLVPNLPPPPALPPTPSAALPPAPPSSPATPTDASAPPPVVVAPEDLVPDLPRPPDATPPAPAAPTLPPAPTGTPPVPDPSSPPPFVLPPEAHADDGRIVVPPFLDRTVAQARRIADDAGLVLKEEATEHGMPGRVMDQTPAAGERVARGSTVVVRVPPDAPAPTAAPVVPTPVAPAPTPAAVPAPAPSETLIVPSVLDRTEPVARKILEDAGLRVREEAAANGVVGRVMDQVPLPGDRVAPGTEVLLKIPGWQPLLPPAPASAGSPDGEPPAAVPPTIPEPVVAPPPPAPLPAPPVEPPVVSPTPPPPAPAPPTPSPAVTPPAPPPVEPPITPPVVVPPPAPPAPEPSTRRTELPPLPGTLPPSSVERAKPPLTVPAAAVPPPPATAPVVERPPAPPDDAVPTLPRPAPVDATPLPAPSGLGTSAPAAAPSPPAPPAPPPTDVAPAVPPTEGATAPAAPRTPASDGVPAVPKTSVARTVPPPPEIGVPTLSAPAPGTALAMATLVHAELAWTAVADVDGYLLEVEESVDGTWMPILRKTVREPKAVLEIEPVNGASTYRWRVRGVAGRRGGRAAAWSTLDVR